MIRISSAVLSLLLFGGFTGPSAGQSPLASTGRIEMTGSDGTCSAALVAADVAITAAHCVDPERVRTGRAAQYFFRPGFPENAPPLAVVDAVRHPLYAPGRDLRWRYPFDLAVVRLARGLPGRINPPLRPGPRPRPGENLTILSWTRSRETPGARSCPVLPGADQLVTLGCPVKGGESGGAVLRQGADGAQIVAVLTSRTRIGGLAVGQAAPVDLRLAPMLRLLD